MGYIRLRHRQFWSVGASEARPRFGSLGPECRHSQSAVAAALCRENRTAGWDVPLRASTPKVRSVAYPADSSVWRRDAAKTCSGERLRHYFPHTLSVRADKAVRAPVSSFLESALSIALAFD